MKLIKAIGFIDNSDFSPIGHYAHIKIIYKSGYREHRLSDAGYSLFCFLKRLKILKVNKISENWFGQDGKIHTKETIFYKLFSY